MLNFKKIMLIQITNKCNEKCIHCLVNSTPDGNDMDLATFEKSVDFAIKVKARAIILSGGDVFLNPNVFRMVNILEAKYKKARLPFSVILESNGWWHDDESMKSRIYKLLDKDCVHGMQISTHKLYYPNYETTCQYFENNKLHPKIKFVKDWQGNLTHLKFMGRARNFMKEEDINGVPGCLNIVSRALSLKGLGKPFTMSGLIKECEETFHNCVPFITIAGNIQLSEGADCLSVANVKESLSLNSLLLDICKFRPCDRCKCLKNLPEYQKTKLDELQRKF